MAESEKNIEMGKRLKELRTSQNINQSSIANYLGIDQSTLAKIESGKRSSRDYVIGKTDKYTPLNFAFRSKKVSVEDLEAIAVINKIVLNIEFLDNLKEDD